MINLIFRYDDYSYDSNINLEKSLFNTFTKNKIPLTIGVIPFRYNNIKPINSFTAENISSKSIKREILKNGLKNNLIEIAQHGHSHYNYQQVPNAEFQGIPKKVQEELIIEGKQLIEKFFKLRLETFIPPWNRYNQDTIEILENSGFNILSAGEKGIFNKKSTINYIPSTCNIKEFFEIINNTNYKKLNNQTFIILLHEYDFVDTENKKKNSINYLDSFLRKLLINNHFSFYTFKDFTESNKFADYKYSFSYYKIFRFFKSLLPTFLYKKVEELNTLPTNKILINIFIKVILHYLCLITIPTAIFFNFFLEVIGIDKKMFFIILILISILFSTLIIFIWIKEKLYGRYFRFSFFLLGLLLCLVLKLSFFA